MTADYTKQPIQLTASAVKIAHIVSPQGRISSVEFQHCVLLFLWYIRIRDEHCVSKNDVFSMFKRSSSSVAPRLFNDVVWPDRVSLAEVSSLENKGKIWCAKPFLLPKEAQGYIPFDHFQTYEWLGKDTIQLQHSCKCRSE
jgi:hypothetical protein